MKASSSKKSRICEGNALSKSGEWGAQTLYCMSQEEFLKTAKEILEKVKPAFGFTMKTLVCLFLVKSTQKLYH